MKISLCMIVKNEEKYIKMCLENAMKLADEAIIVDTGSTDRTKEIINEFDGNIRIIDYEWEDDFSKARNISLEAATGDWILMLDADEKILCNPEIIRGMLENSLENGYRVPLYNIMNLQMIVYSDIYAKLFRNNKKYRYFGRIHEQLEIPNIEKEECVIDSDLCKIIHYGYLNSVVRDKNKTKRNLKILKEQLKENPNEPFIYYNMGVTYGGEKNYSKALECFFKCNEIQKNKASDGIAVYEIDMVKRIAECLVNLEKYYDCIKLVDELLNIDWYKGFVDLEYISGYCYYAQGKYKQAIERYEKCVEIGDTKKFISVFGMGSFKAKFMMAKCYAELKEEVKAINCFMESIFDTNNFMHEGIDDFRKYLKSNNRIEILNQLNKLVGKDN